MKKFNILYGFGLTLLIISYPLTEINYLLAFISFLLSIFILLIIKSFKL